MPPEPPPEPTAASPVESSDEWPAESISREPPAASSESPPGTSPSIVPPGFICQRCGYRLDGLQTSDRCPECGTPAAVSLTGSRLRSSEPEFVRTLHRSSRIVMWSLWGQFVLVLLVIGLEVSESVTSGIRTPRSLWTLGESLVSLTHVGLSVLLLFGWWGLTTPNPIHARADSVPDAAVLRGSIRLFQILALFTTVLMAMSTVAAMVAQVAPGVVRSVTGLNWLVYIVLGSLRGAWIQRLARQMPDPGLATMGGVLVWLHPLLTTVGCVALALGPLAAWILSLVAATQLSDRLGRFRRQQAADAARLGATSPVTDN